MSATAFAIVLLAAAVHAGWNVLVKASADTRIAAFTFAMTAAALAAVIVPFVALPAPGAWPFLFASATVQISYFVALSASYRAADMSLAYPVMRGSAPMLVALATPWLGDPPLSPAGWLAIAVICAGILLMAVPSRGARASGRGLAMALGTAVLIASYTLIDGAGVRRSGHALAYTLWLSLLTGIPITLWLIARHRAALTAFLRKRWRLAVAGGVGSFIPYGLSLWAMTQAPVALVAALRESSVVFGTALSVLVLGESVSPRRVLAALVILSGAIAIRLA